MAHNHEKQGGIGGFLSSAGGGAAITGLSGLLGGFAGLIGGPSESQKRSRSIFDLIKNRFGQSAFDPQQSLVALIQSLAPRFNRQAEGINRRLGLDSGVAQGELAQGQQSTLAGILAEFNKFGAQLNQQKNQFDISALLNSARSS